MSIDIQIAEAAGWRALITKAQVGAAIELSHCVEEYLVATLFRRIGRPERSDPMAPLRFLDELVEMRSFGGCENSRDVGDQCLITAGLFPEHAIERGIPITYFVQAGTHAYLEYHGRAREELYGYLASSFVACMDVLQTLRESENGEPCIDAVNAYDLWWEAGSSHAWRALRHFTPALPGGQTTGNFH